MSSLSQLESLPHELITHIATFVEALSVVRLSRTSKTIRSACWDPLVFKTILRRSQRHHWRHDMLDHEGIAERAGSDVSVWARYAVADDMACVLKSIKDPLQSRRHSIAFLPELAIVKHPFSRQSCWHMATHGPFDYLTSHVFSLTMAVLSADDAGLARFHDPGQCEYCFSKPRENEPSFLDGEGSLWTLCSIAVTLRDWLRMRRSVWPYNTAANHPYIDFPRAERIPLRPLRQDYALPVPFSSRAADLLNSFTSNSSSWNEWYRAHNHALFDAVELFTSGSWCGYYTYNTTRQPLDPPMTAISFKHHRTGVSHQEYNDAFSIGATDCTDGVGTFHLNATVTWDGYAVRVRARKIYEINTVWDWDCRLTPFGVVGHWGTRFADSFETLGYVWLWKAEWNAPRGGSGDGSVEGMHTG